MNIKQTAKLAAISLSEEELARIEKDMKTVLALADKMPDIDGELTVDPDNVMTLREDKAVSGKYTRDELFAGAPEIQAGCIVVPRTVE